MELLRFYQSKSSRELVGQAKTEPGGSALYLDAPQLAHFGSAMGQNAYEELGRDKLRDIVQEFYERLFKDDMIGFLFVGKDKARLVEREIEFSARLLGGSVPYRGRSMREAHAASPILGGHFERRLQILREVLADFDVAPSIQERWIRHSEALREQITADKGTDCRHEKSLGRARPKKSLYRDDS